MSDTWQNVPPDLLAWLMQQTAPAPEWSVGEQAYQPTDVGSQQAGLNYTQDYWKTLMDPTYFMGAEGAFDPYSMQSVGQKPDPGSSEGADYLQKIAMSAPGSPEALIASAILSGATPRDAIASAAKVTQLPKDPKDPSQYDPGLTKFAESAWDKYLNDKAPSGPQTPWEAAGFSDPSQRFTPDLFNQEGVQRASAKADSSKSAYDAAYKKAMQAKTTKPDSSSGGGGGGLPPLGAVVAGPAALIPGTPANALVGGGLDAAKGVVNGTPGSYGRAVAGAVGGALGAINPFSGGAAGALGVAPPSTIPLSWAHMPNSRAVHAAQTVMPILGAMKARGDRNSAFENPTTQAFVNGTKYVGDARAAAREKMKARAEANDTANTYGSPFLMQLAQRQAMLRQMGLGG